MIKHLPTSLFRVEHVWSSYGHIAKPSKTAADVMAPEYWQHVAPSLKPRDELIVLAEDNSFEVRMRVVGKAGTQLLLRTIELWEQPVLDAPLELPATIPQPEQPAATDGLIVNFAPAHGWRVVNNDSKEVVSKGHATREEAQQAMTNILAARRDRVAA